MERAKFKLQNIIAFLILLFCIALAQAQNVGVGQQDPKEKLDIDGALRIGQALDSLEGTIQYQDGAFRGKNPTRWELMGLPSSAIVLSDSYENQTLLDEGYDFLGETRIPAKTYVQWPPNNFISNFWYPVYSKGNPEQLSSPFPSSNFVWADSVLVVYSRGSGSGFHFYDPTTNLWERSTLNLPLAYIALDGQLHHVGDELIFLSGNSGNPGFRYHLQTESITYFPSMPVSYFQKKDFRTEMIQNWIVVYGGTEDNVSSNDGLILDLNNNTWSIMNSANAPPPLVDYGSCGLLQEFVVFGGRSSTSQYVNFQTAGKYYDIPTNGWFDLPTANQPKARVAHSMVAIDSDQFVIFGGLVNQPNEMRDTSDGVIYHILNGWVSPFDLPGYGRADHAATLDSSGNVIVYGGVSGVYNGGLGPLSNIARTDGFVLDPGSGTISSELNDCFLDSAVRFGGHAIYNGSRLFVTGGSCNVSAFFSYSLPLPIECNAHFESLVYNFTASGPSPVFYRPQSFNYTWYMFQKN